MASAYTPENPLPGLIAFLKEKNVLIVLDSCEHVIEAAATFAEEIFSGTKRPHILATSREALRAEGEHVYRLPPLAFPSEAENLKAADALGFPAVQLFVDRAAASLGSFELADAEASFVAEICRRLDGIPLAIEIAASRVDTFGVAGLAAGLNDRFQLLMQGRRTALPRHRTLSATLDWSYSQLSEIEQLVLRRLAIFVGAFTMEAASAVLAQADISAAAIIDAIANLVAKSLVWADVGGAIAFYRLFDVTRTYALAKLEESGERDRIARAHAEYYRSALEKAQSRLGDQARCGVAAAPPAYRGQCARRAGLGILAGRRSRDGRGDHRRSCSALVRAVAHERVRRTRRQSADRPLRQPRRAERDAPLRRAGLVADADAGRRYPRRRTPGHAFSN